MPSNFHNTQHVPSTGRPVFPQVRSAVRGPPPSQIVPTVQTVSGAPSPAAGHKGPPLPPRRSSPLPATPSKAHHSHHVSSQTRPPPPPPQRVHTPPRPQTGSQGSHSQPATHTRHGRNSGEFIKLEFDSGAGTRPVEEDVFHIDLVPNPQNPPVERIRAMDESTKIMTAAAMRSINSARSGIASGNLSWEAVLSALMQNPVLELGDKVDRADRLVKSTKSWFKLDGAPDPHTVREVESWFENLVADREVLSITKVNIGELARIVAQTGVAMTTPQSLFYRKERQEKTLADVGVIFLPDRDRRYFKIYRIKLIAWSSSTRVAVGQENYNGIVGEFYSRQFGPREAIIASLRPEVKQKALSEVEHLFA